MDYVSGDGNMYPPAVEVHLVCFKFHQSNSDGKNNNNNLSICTLHTKNIMYLGKYTF